VDAAGIQTQFYQILEYIKTPGPIHYLFLFLLIQALMIKKLSSLENKGLEGTVVGTLIMPYCSGVSNLIFAFVLGRSGMSGIPVLENCLVNNVTNLTLILGITAIACPLIVRSPSRKGKLLEREKLNQLSLILTLVASVFFTGILWALGKDGVLTFSDGLVLVGIFIFWQILHVIEVLKRNIKKRHTFQIIFYADLVIISLCVYLTYISIEYLVDWFNAIGSTYIPVTSIGWISGIVMVIPNALLAVYYAFKDRGEIVYSSQVGDGHICIPMCIGLFALFNSTDIPGFFTDGILVLFAAGILHLILITFFGRLSRISGIVFVLGYGWFIYAGLV